MNQHYFRLFIIFLAYIGLPFFLQGCALPAYLPGQQAIGNLRIVGDHVRVNNRPAIDGETIQHDDEITTGAKSSAFVECYTCGLIQLDENTDPRFSHLWQGFNPNFVIDTLRIGQIFVDFKKSCTLNIKPQEPVESSLKGEDIQYNIKVDPIQTIITVLKGVLGLTKPSNMIITENQQIIITKDGVKSIRNLSKPEIVQVTQWRNNFPHPGPLVRAGSRKVCECVE